MSKKILSSKAKYFMFLLSLCVVLTGCVPDANTNVANTNTVSENTNANAEANTEANSDISIYTDEEENITEEDVEKGRSDEGWKSFAELDKPTEKTTSRIRKNTAI